MTQQPPKHNYIQTANINGIKGILTVSSSGDRGHCTTESHRSPTIEVHTRNTRSQNRSIQEAEVKKGRVSQIMGRQRNNPQMKGKEESSERMLKEKEASQLSDNEFKAMVIRKLTELTENY